MAVNESISEIISILLQNTKIGEYANNILLGIGGIASATFIYFIIMIILKYKEYKLQQRNTDLINSQAILIKRIYDEMFIKK